jgi:dolichol kinase
VKEIFRQFVHLFFGLVIFFGLFFLPSQVMLYLLSGSIFIGFVIADAVSKGLYVPLFSEIIHSLERDVLFPGYGTLLFLLSSFFVLVLFGPVVAGVSVLVLAVLDSFSTIFGVYAGKHKLYGKKSVEGFIGGIIPTFLVLLLVISPLQAGIIAIIGGIVELFSPIDDNLTIPVAVALMMVLLGGG